MLLLKLSGLVLIFSTFSLAGFCRSFILKKRNDRLREICISLSKFAQLVRNGSGELKGILELSFGRKIISFVDDKPRISDSYLERDDIHLIESFLNESGMSDRESEYKRALLYQTLFEQRSDEATKKAENLSKLYTSLGVLSGLSICIFLV